MKKLLSLFTAVLLVCSCSDDDTKPAEPTDVVLRPCANGIILVLNTQEEVNAFAEKAYCSVGEIKIGSPDLPSNITTLAPLATILDVQAGITITNNPVLTSLEGLHNIEKAAGKLTITNNAALTSLAGLRSLEIREGLNKEVFDIEISNNASLQNFGFTKLKRANRVIITNNAELQSIAGLENITALNTLEIVNNDKLVNLNGLQGSTKIDYLTVSENDTFESLEGLNAITSAIYVTISGNPQLVSVEVLENITTLNTLEIRGTTTFNALQPLHNMTNIRTLVLIENNGLTSLEGLNNLTNSNYIQIDANNSLTSIAALSSLTVINEETPSEGTGGLFISNTALTSLDGLQNVTNFKGSLLISENTALANLCALQGIVTNGELVPPFSYIASNLYNPTFQDIEDGICSMD